MIKLKETGQAPVSFCDRMMNRKTLTLKTIATPAWRRYRAAIFEGYLVVAVIIFAILAVLAHTIAYFTFDLVITKDIQTFHGVVIDSFMRLITWIGYSPQGPLLVAIAVLFLYISGLKWEAVVTLLSNIGISVLGTGIKLLVVRPRPSPDLVNVFTTLSDYAFPSGHVLFFMTFFGFLAFLAFTLLKPAWGRSLIIAICIGLILLIGFSRIYLGAHWASDVIAAYLLGSVWLTLTVRVYRWGKPRYLVDQSIAKEPPTA